jgi:hypothetical protein
MVSLNEVSNFVEAITGSNLKDLIVKAGVGAFAQCSTHCDCNNRYCACRGSVTSATAGDLVSFPEFLELKEERIRELQHQLKLLEVPGKK